MKIFIRTLKSDFKKIPYNLIFTLEVDPLDTIENVKDKLRNQEGSCSIIYK